MPTDTFFKLDNEKKEQILMAAQKEFSENPYAKVSIFKIAQQAGISRSGFYYYFKDKKDIYEHLLNNIKNEFVSIYAVKGKPEMDIFTLAEHVYDFITGLKGTDREPFFRMIISDVTPEYLKNFFIKAVNEERYRESEIKVTLDNINYNSVQELRGIIFLIASSIIFSAGSYFENEESLEEGKNKLYQMFNILKYGISKGDKE